MSGMVTLEVRVLKTWDRHVAVCADGVRAVLPIAEIDLVPGPTSPWATLTLPEGLARGWCLVRTPPAPDPLHDALITHFHTAIQPGDRCA